MNEGELLLESTPHIFPPVGGDYGHPNISVSCQGEIAEVQGRTIEDVKEEASRNWEQLYN